MTKRAFAALFTIIFLAGAGLRLARLDLRPMHHDEANQALKLGLLLEKGEYRYDPADHHGPSLYYLSLPFALTLSGTSLANLDEATLRLVPALFGLGTILLLLLFIPLMGRAAVAWGALALAVSPVMGYFSRFYIQEMILVFFLVGLMAAVWRYRRRPGWGWALAAGLCAGLMYATKETAIISWAAMAAALIIARPAKKRHLEGTETGSAALPGRDANERGSISERTGVPENESKQGIESAEKSAVVPGAKPGRPAGPVGAHGLAAVGVGLAVAFLLFSSFFRNPGGFLDSILSYRVYFARAGEAGFHVHPWSYYLGKLAFVPGHGGPAWSEGLVLALAIVGAVAAFTLKDGKTAGWAVWGQAKTADRPAAREGRPSLIHAFARFLAIYAALAAMIYSAIPYKTPWNILPFHIGFIMLAGFGAAFLVSCPRRNTGKLAVAAILAVAFVQLGAQSYRANFVYPADTRNPYVYAQTSTDYTKLVRRVEDIAALAPERRGLLIKVVAGPDETWPLPWSLRRFPTVGYWRDAAAAGDIDRPPLVISSAVETAKLEPVLKTDYQSEFYGLRPGVLLTLSIRSDLWEAFLRSRAR